ncbi:uncharacterized protein LOC119607538 [Lucilia sericata]|uniref:uncharacterized protein LOC119607538 n=1 Tax=Lucilia sericata TaxID=13632 RepID=UPI0018A87146|nr:uncharacterized protein LOC119607538 [Lucilia sericata]
MQEKESWFTPTYSKKFRKEWKTNPQLRDWISESDNASKAFCRYCNCNLQCKFSDLIAHASTNKHKTAKGGFVQQNKIPFQSSNHKVQMNEAALSKYFCQHGPIAPVDHLTSLLKKQFDDSTNCQQIRLHITKCSKIVKNVLSIHFKEDLQKDIGDSHFILLFDESTDIEIVK